MTLRLDPRRCALAFLGSAILAFGLFNVHSLSDVTEGGVLGLSLLLEHHFAISPALSALILNALCYFLGWRILGRDFIGYSIFAGGGFSLCYAIFENLPPLFPKIAEMPLLAAVSGALFVGIGCGLAVRAGGAPSGDDALAMSVSKHFKVSIWWAYFISDSAVLLLSLSYIPPERILFSFITVVLSGQIVDLLQRIGRSPEKEASSDAPCNALVGTLRNREQLTAALAGRFYHIPAIRIDREAIPPEYIAIYQSLHKFSDNPGVIYYGEVEKYSLVQRHEIKEIPRDSSELYYRFDIKEWKTLPEKIIPDRDDFIAVSTSFHILQNARTTSELFFRSTAEFDLYRRVEKLLAGEIEDIPLKKGNIKLCVMDGRLVVLKDLHPFFTCSVDDYKENPQKTFSHFSKFL